MIGDGKVINVSIEDIKERLLKGEPVHFVEDQDETKRTIKAQWITNALKKEYDVDKIDIKSAIITDDLDFHINDNLVNIDKSGMEVDEIKKQNNIGFKSVFLISSSIVIENCQLQGNLLAGRYRQESFVIFKSQVSFSRSEFIEAVYFGYARFNGVAHFGRSGFMYKAANFRWAIFRNAIFKEKADFENAIFKEKADFGSASFKEKADFGYASFNGVAYFGCWSGSKVKAASFRNAIFRNASFKGKTDFGYASFKEKADFENAIFKEKADFRSASFNGVVDFSSASLEKANLRDAVLTDSKFIDTNLKDAILTRVDLTGSLYEPNSSTYQGSLGGIKGLEKVKFNKGQQGGLVQLRSALKESGLRDLEREATYAIEHWKAHYEPWYKKWPKHVLFEWTCGYGLDYLRPLLILLCLIVVFSILI